MPTALAVLFGVLLIAGLAWRQLRRQRALRERRARLFDDCLGLFEAPRLNQTGVEYPRLVGFVRGVEVQLTPVIDNLTARKLPSLWLLATLVKPTAIATTIDAMMRPNGLESFSNFHRLRHSVTIPAGWPEEAVIRAEDPEALPPAAAFEPAARFLALPGAKEVLISPKGVRLVTLVDQGERAYYVVLRQASFAIERISSETARLLIERLFLIHDELERWKRT